MTVDIKVPDMGESVIEATVSRWMKQAGDPVAPGEAVVELETDKVNLEVGTSQAGILSEILKQPGDTVSVGDILARVSPEGAGSAQPAPSTQKAEAEKAAAPEKTSETSQPTSGGNGGETAAAATAVPSATPVAQRMALDLGIDLNTVKPTGSGGRITKEDVETAAASRQAEPGQTGLPAAQKAGTPESGPAQSQPATQPAPQASAQPAAQATSPNAPAAKAPAGDVTRIRMTRRRQTIARRLVEAQHTAAMLTTFNEVDMSAVMDVRKRRREGFKERYGVDLGFMPFFVKASIGALRAFPYLNAEIAPAENGADEIVLKHYYDIGIAIGAEEGLVVPVIRNADRLSFAEVEKSIRDYANKARENSLTLDDLRGGTFTITNGGVFGSLLSTPILNPPQVAILGMHKIQERPVVVKGEIAARPMMYLALSYDHRIVDGREAVQFLVRLKELVEDPEALLFS